MAQRGGCGGLNPATSALSVIARRRTVAEPQMFLPDHAMRHRGLHSMTIGSLY